MSVEHTPEAQASGAPPSPKDESPRRFPFVAVIVGVAALALALYVATQVIGVLYGIIAPPAPPLPSDVQQTSYTNRAHGVDTWSYSVPMEACAVARYYVSLGATCEYALMQCTAGETDPTPFSASEIGIARCTGETKFSIFTMGYTIAISHSMGALTTSQIEVEREVYWTRTG
ncbi:MAG: hypothetical protein SGI73_04045 [Chloroflexota bacterium]|nr:hypothetical protein [Chloroflexota bacterium]